MNKFEILEVIGEGAYGIVLKCKNRENMVRKFHSTTILIASISIPLYWSDTLQVTE